MDLNLIYPATKPITDCLHEARGPAINEYKRILAKSKMLFPGENDQQIKFLTEEIQKITTKIEKTIVGYMWASQGYPVDYLKYDYDKLLSIFDSLVELLKRWKEEEPYKIANEELIKFLEGYLVINYLRGQLKNIKQNNKNTSNQKSKSIVYTGLQISLYYYLLVKWRVMPSFTDQGPTEIEAIRKQLKEDGFKKKDGKDFSPGTIKSRMNSMASTRKEDPYTRNRL